LKIFHGTYLDTIETLIPDDYQPQLLRRGLLPTDVVGYVSTQFGAGYEYKPGETFSISVRKGSRRVEELLLEVPSRFRNSREMIRLEGHNTLGALTLSGSFPFRLENGADAVKIIDLGVELGNWTRVIHYAELTSVRSAEYWSDSNAIARAKDELLLGVIDVQRMRDTGATSILAYISAYKPKQVLVLGDFSPEGRRRLNDIKAHLTALGYSPIFVDELPDVPHFDLMQKLVAVASSCKFIIMDDSSKSGHLSEFPLVAQNRWYAAILRLSGSRSTFMTRGVAETTQTMVEYEYDASSLSSVLATATAELEKRIDAQEERLRLTFPWRGENSPG
jgi:hypothetical protein